MSMSMKIALNTYSLRNEWKKLAKHGIDPVGKLCQDHGVTELEFLDRHIADDGAGLPAQVKKFADYGVHVFALGPHVKLLAREKQVPEMVEQGKYWLQLAAENDIHKVRFQVGDGPMPRCFPPMDDFNDEEWTEYREMIDDALEFTDKVTRPLLDAAESLDVHICIETHHSYSSNHVYMKQFNEKYPSDHVGWIFDIGNYENDAMRWQGLDVIKDRTKYIHAKAYKFDDQGLETKLDFPRVAKTLGAAGFTGEWSIEFEGRMNGLLGFLRSLELVKYSIAECEGESYEMRTDFPSGKALLKQYKA